MYETGEHVRQKVKNAKSSENARKMRESTTYRPIVFGALASLGLIVVYFLVLSFANSVSHALQQFLDLWYWMSILIVGFGVQVGLYTVFHDAVRAGAVMGVARSSVAGTGGVSTLSMIACCAHHFTDVLPLLGFSAAALFLVQYQTLFIVLGVLSNLVGIAIMLRMIQEHGVDVSACRVLSRVMKYDMKKVFYVVVVFSAIAFIVTLIISVGG